MFFPRRTRKITKNASISDHKSLRDLRAFRGPFFIPIGSNTPKLASVLVGRIGSILRFGSEEDRAGPPYLHKYPAAASAGDEVESLLRGFFIPIGSNTPKLLTGVALAKTVVVDFDLPVMSGTNGSVAPLLILVAADLRAAIEAGFNNFTIMVPLSGEIGRYLLNTSRACHSILNVSKGPGHDLFNSLLGYRIDI